MSSLNTRPRHWRDRVALHCLGIGSILVPVIAWGVGSFLLLTSNTWTRRQKVRSVLLWPCGLAFPFAMAALVGSGHDSGPPIVGITVLIAMITVSVIVQVGLWRSIPKRRPAT